MQVIGLEVRLLFKKLLAGMFLVFLLLPLAGCKSDYPVSAKKNPMGDSPAPKPVKTTRVADTTVERIVTVTGTLNAYDQATLSLKVPGRLREISVDLGSVVQKGQTVAQIEQEDYHLREQQAEAALAQARARLGLATEGNNNHIDPEQTGTVRQAHALLDEAQANRERNTKLLDQGVISRSQFDATEANYKVAHSRYQDALEEIRNRQAILEQRQSELAIARQQYADTTITAPFDGVVLEKRASIGEYLAAGAPIATLVRVNPLRLRVEIPERDAKDIKVNQRVRVTVEGHATAYTGQIKRLSPSITQQTRMLMVEAEVANDGTIRPGTFTSTEIVTDDQSKIITVPPSAIVTFAGIDKVIFIKDGKAVEKAVTLGRRTPQWIEILNGVKAGDVVVVEPGNLQAGQAVKIVE